MNVSWLSSKLKSNTEKCLQEVIIRNIGASSAYRKWFSRALAAGTWTMHGLAGVGPTACLPVSGPAAGEPVAKVHAQADKVMGEINRK